MSFSAFDHECMAEALRLGRKGLYTTDPNPRVGCVLADGRRILAGGYHARAGGPHAEVAALAGLGQAGVASTGLTAYVTLEPCNHHGRTPPCVDALLAAGVARVVIAAADPNPRVNGSGMERLRAAGVQVQSGLMAAEAEALNPGFIKRMRDGLPWVRVKSAVSLDGRTALPSGESQWITGEAARRDVQRWRARSGAVLTGIGTVLADDPRLDARVDEPVAQPLRVVVDSGWRTPPQARLLAGGPPVLIAGVRERPVPPALQASGAEMLPLEAGPGGVRLDELLRELARREINEVQVEAGARLCGALLEAGLVDEVLLYQAPLLLGAGGPGPFALGPLESMAERTHLECLESRPVGGDLRLRLQPLPRS